VRLAGAAGVIVRMERQVALTSAALAVVARCAIVIACIGLIAMTLVEAWQVFARYVLNDSPSWTEPVALLLMSTAMMLGAAVGVRNESHFGFFLVVHTAAAPVRRVLVSISRLMMIAIGLLLAYWGGVLLADGWDVRMAGASLPQGLYFLPICIGGVLIALFALEWLLVAPAAAPRGEH
jgi:TRAP-type C4-dicarboxylate transport system permease small subunit